MATVSIGLRVDRDMKAALERAAHNDHRSVSQLIKKILIEWLEAQSNAEGDLFAKPAARRRA